MTTSSRRPVEALRAALDAGGVALVDVRTPGEFNRGHVQGAVNIPLSMLDPAALPAGGEVWVICRTGARSAFAAEQIAAAGLPAVDVEGGMVAWEGNGWPVERVARATAAPSAFVFLLPLAASLTLGLAPFFPEPHIVGKLRWIAGGAVGMSGMDWFDVALHGAPWLWLIGAVVFYAVRRLR